MAGCDRKGEGGWQRFRAGRPGHRFQERYRRHQRSSGGRLGSAAYLKAFVGRLVGK